MEWRMYSQSTEKTGQCWNELIKCKEVKYDRNMPKSNLPHSSSFTNTKKKRSDIQRKFTNNFQSSTKYL